MFKSKKEPQEKDKMIILYADGGHRSSTKASAYSYYLQYKSLEKLEGYAVYDKTNNEMEITAVLEGLRAIKNSKLPVKVYSDSQYTIRCLQEKWYLGWERDGWHNSKKEPVKNADLWRELIKEVGRFPFISYSWTKGHSTNALNNLVDEKNNLVMDEWEKRGKNESKRHDRGSKNR